MDYFQVISLGIFPFLFVFIGLEMGRRGVENWILRKYYHILQYGLLALDGVIIESAYEIILSVALFFSIAIVLTLLTSFDVNSIIKSGVRDGENYLALQINNGLTIVISILILFLLGRWVFVLTTLVLALGDGLGELIGRPFGRIKYKLLSTKSVLGSLAVMLGALTSLILVNYLFDLLISPTILILYAIFYTISEAVAFTATDNLFLHGVSIAIYYIRQI